MTFKSLSLLQGRVFLSANNPHTITITITSSVLLTRVNSTGMMSSNCDGPDMTQVNFHVVNTPLSTTLSLNSSLSIAGSNRASRKRPSTDNAHKYTNAKKAYIYPPLPIPVDLSHDDPIDEFILKNYPNWSVVYASRLFVGWYDPLAPGKWNNTLHPPSLVTGDLVFLGTIPNKSTLVKAETKEARIWKTIQYCVSRIASSTLPPSILKRDCIELCKKLLFRASNNIQKYRFVVRLFVIIFYNSSGSILLK